ncbi:hypothetical protein [Amaricoccus macauensis]
MKVQDKNGAAEEADRRNAQSKHHGKPHSPEEFKPKKPTEQVQKGKADD